MDIDKIWLEYRKRLLSFINSRIASGMDGEDILQTVFEKLLRYQNSLKSEEKLLPWLFRITENTIHDTYRIRFKNPTNSGTDSILELPASQDQRRALEELGACLLPFLERLDEPGREAIQKVELGGMTRTDLARELGISVSAVKSRIQRGREKLFKMIHDCCQIEINQYGDFVDYEVKSTVCHIPCD